MRDSLRHRRKHSDMIFLKDAEELRFLRLNKAGEELLGYSRAELFKRRL